MSNSAPRMGGYFAAAVCLAIAARCWAQSPAGAPVVLAETPYVAVTTCVDQLLRIGSYQVLCNDHSHPYHYGGAVLISETWNDKGRAATFYKLCFVDSTESCRHVQLLRR